MQGADLCIDATHPYAVEATKNIRAAAARAGVEYHRLLRAPQPAAGGSTGVCRCGGGRPRAGPDGGQCPPHHRGQRAGSLFPHRTGAVLPPVLPTQEGIAACEAAGVPHRNIIAMQGPFSRALNEALIQQFEIRWLVTKDGGAAGGFAEKVQAAQSTGAQLVVLRRPPEQGQTAQEILNLCKEKML